LREQVIDHLETHATRDGLELRLGTRVGQLARGNGGWRVATTAGEIDAPQVVVATGHEGEPLIPDWPGRASFTAPLIHSHDYKTPDPFKGKHVLVVGPGCSGMEIAHDLAEGGAAKVQLAVRTPPNITLREGPGPLSGDMIAVAMLYLPTKFGDAMANFARRMDIGDLTEFGLPVPEEGTMSRFRRLGVAPAIVDKEVIEAIKAGRIEVVRGVASLDETGVELADGARVEPDAVICATGYGRVLEPLVGHLGVLDERGMPRARGARSAAPGLRFIGYVPRPGGLGYMGKESRKAARANDRELRVG
jgi:glycine/D-amino acid oxidase-like deaminating enzyme